MPIKVIVDRSRAAHLLDTLMLAFRAKTFPFNLKKVLPPQIPENLPGGGFRDEVDHACYLFALCFYMRGGIQSDRAALAFSKIYEKRPELFRPQVVTADMQPDIQALLAQGGLNFKSGEISRFWVENFRRLKEQWGSDPRTILKGVDTFEEACERIQNTKQNKKRGRGFLGFQEKMVSMLIYFLVEAGYGDPFTFPVPIDFHVLRVMVAHHVVCIIEGAPPSGRVNYFHKDVLGALRDLFSWYARTHNTDPVHLSEVVWGLSRSMCYRHPGNATVRRGKRRGRKSDLVPRPVTWNSTQAAAYKHTCLRCPVEPTCRFNIPSAPYYMRGELVIRGFREQPPQKRLF